MNVAAKVSESFQTHGTRRYRAGSGVQEVSLVMFLFCVSLWLLTVCDALFLFIFFFFLRNALCCLNSMFALTETQDQVINPFRYSGYNSGELIMLGDTLSLLVQERVNCLDFDRDTHHLKSPQWLSHVLKHNNSTNITSVISGSAGLSSPNNAPTSVLII